MDEIKKQLEKIPEKTYYRIGEVARITKTKPYVLRFWETKFSQVRPLKRGGGRRYYRPEDVELLRHIRDLLYTEGYTIKGVQRLLRESGGKAVVEEPSAGEGEGLTASQRKELKALKDELMALRELLKSVKP